MTKKPRDSDPLVLEVPTEDEKLMLEIRRESKTVLGQWPLQTEDEGKYWGTEVLIYGVVWLIGRYTSFVNAKQQRSLCLGGERRQRS